MVQLLINDHCHYCETAVENWQAACQEHHVDCKVLELDTPEGQELANSLFINVFPAVVIDGQLRAIGSSSREEAKALLSRH